MRARSQDVSVLGSTLITYLETLQTVRTCPMQRQHHAAGMVCAVSETTHGEAVRLPTKLTFCISVYILHNIY